MPRGLYLHVPFCPAKCAYCDFVSYPHEPEKAALYEKALRREMALRRAGFPPGSAGPRTVFIGGGTPTVLPADMLGRILKELYAYFPWPAGAEVTVEANPGTVDRESLTALAAAGVNRLSIGMQAAQDRLLSFLGRRHRADEPARAVRAAREAGIDNLNLDLLFGVPGQTLDDWRFSLEAALSLEPTHIAAYGLEITRGTRLHALLERGRIRACPEETGLEMYQTARTVLAAHGYRHYEISNFARPGFECRHNLHYWENGDYLGLGPAAHSHFRGRRRANERSVERYAARLAAGEAPVEMEERLDERTQMAETMFMGLRLRRGVDPAAFQRRFGRAAEEVWAREIRRLTADGLLERADGYLRLTEKGLPVANNVFAAFV